MSTPTRVPARLGPSLPPELLMLGSIVSIQGGSALAVTLFDQVGPAGMASLKAGFAAAGLCAAARPWRGAALRPHAGRLGLLGLVIAAMFAASYESLARLPLGVAATIGFVGPLGLAAWHARHWTHLLWMGLAVLGLLTLAPGAIASAAGSSAAGLAWAGLSALAWAGFVVSSQRVAAVVPGLRGLAVGMALAALLLLPYAAVSAGRWHLTPAVLGLIAGIATLSSTVPLALEFSALRRLSPRGYGVLVSTEPAVAALIGALTLDQLLGWQEVCGILLICAASLGISLTDRAR